MDSRLPGERVKTGQATADEGGEALHWPPDGDKFRLLGGVLLALFAAYAAVFLTVTAIRLTAGPAGDFFALWSVARFILGHPAAQIYDPASLKAFQLALGMPPATDYPFPYPPNFLLALWPVGLLPYLPAYGVAIGLTLVFYLWATAGGEWRSPLTLAALVAPTTTITIVAGQAGFLAAGLVIGGFRLTARRPLLAGVLFGLATYKPHLGLLVPVALVACRAWRTIAAAAATAAGLVIVSGLVFGPAVWPAWAASLAGYSKEFASAGGSIGHLMPTVEAGLVRLGLPQAAAHLAQLAAVAIAAMAVWRCFRCRPEPLAAAALFVGMFLATPHALVYDMPPVATAVLWTVGERRRAGAAFGLGEVAILATALVAPITLVAGASTFPLVPLSLVLLLLLIVRRCERLGAGTR